MGVPQERYRRPAKYHLIELDRPGWTASVLSAVGRYEAEAGDELTREQRIEFARLDGIDRLREKVEALAVRDGVTVTQLLAYRWELKDDVVLFLSGARVVGRPADKPDGTLVAKVELPLRRLWMIVRRGMKPIEVDPQAGDSRGGSERGEKGSP